MLQPRDVFLDVIIISNVTHLSECVNVFISHPTVSLQTGLIRSLRNILSVVSYMSSVGSYLLSSLISLKETYSLKNPTSFRLKSACLHFEEELAGFDVRTVVLALFHVEKRGVRHLEFLEWGRDGFHSSR